MKKYLLLFLALLLIPCDIQASQDKFSAEYLASNSHPTIMTHFAEGVAEKAIKKSLKKETGADFDVEITGYNTASMKKGIFKSLELSGENAKINNLDVEYIHFKSLNDYNYIDYTKSPLEIKSDMTYSYDLILTDETINKALENSNYGKTLAKVNNIAGPLFVIKKVRTKIINNRLYVIVEYNFPIVKSSKDRSFVSSCDFQVVNGEIKAKDVYIDSAYGNIGLDKVANLINYLNPLEFTLKTLDKNEPSGNIENVNIVDNKIKVDGKIFLKPNGGVNKIGK